MIYFEFIVFGTVQGVGFRPYIYNACKNNNLTGSVQNIGTGVRIIINDKNILKQILLESPKNMKINNITIKKITASYVNFEILKSSGQGFSEIPADLNLCYDCYANIFDKNNRRYQFFFTTCTNCGPRYSIAKKSPYDRHTTTMHDFKMCKKCLQEYSNPKNRRYHAQTIACADCGPILTLFKNNTKQISTSINAIKKTANLIKANELVSIKGIGGFHIACNMATSTIEKLNKLTGRTSKPFAVMCKNLKMAKKIAEISEKEANILISQERPILLLKKKESLTQISELNSIGILLPNSALHELLFSFYDAPIVMTSSNKSGFPITIYLREQLTSHTLNHTRKISNSVDDSIVKVINDKTLILRRGRGFAPISIPIKSKNNIQILALGAEMNNSFAVYRNGNITQSQYIGNTFKMETFEHFKKSLDKLLKYMDITPEIILCDLHPNFNTSLYGKELSIKFNIPLKKIQHHLSHAYSVASEHNLNSFVSIVCDGAGYGYDNTIWGGEIFVNNKRVGHLEQHKLLGGDSAVKNPQKMLLSILKKILTNNEITSLITSKLTSSFTKKDLLIMCKQWDLNFNSPLTSSCGRVLDAISALLGFCKEQSYDGRCAMLLESNSSKKPYSLKPIIYDNILLTTPLFEFLIKNLHKDKKRLAITAQLYLAQGLFLIASKYHKPITFSGGCSYNSIMTSYLLKKGIYINKNVSPGDGGISHGQIAYFLKNQNDIFNTSLL